MKKRTAIIQQSCAGRKKSWGRNLGVTFSLGRGGKAICLRFTEWAVHEREKSGGAEQNCGWKDEVGLFCTAGRPHVQKEESTPKKQKNLRAAEKAQKDNGNCAVTGGWGCWWGGGGVCGGLGGLLGATL